MHVLRPVETAHCTTSPGSTAQQNRIPIFTGRQDQAETGRGNHSCMQTDTIRRGGKKQPRGRDSETEGSEMGEGRRADPANLLRQETGNCRNFFFCSSHSSTGPMPTRALAVWGGWASGAGTVWDDGRQPTCTHCAAPTVRRRHRRHLDSAANHVPRSRPGCQGLSPSQKAVSIHFMESGPMPTQRRRAQRQASCEGTTHARRREACNGQGSMHEQASLSRAETSHRGHHAAVPQ